MKVPTDRGDMTPEQRVDGWNKANPIGTPVTVCGMDGEPFDAVTISEAMTIGSCALPVVWVDARSGQYPLDMVRPKGEV